jgi:hypothetical protein
MALKTKNHEPNKGRFLFCSETLGAEWFQRVLNFIRARIFFR